MVGPEIIAPIALALIIEHAYQKGHLEIAVKWLKEKLTPAALWVKENVLPESLFQDEEKAKDIWYFDDDDDNF